MFWFNFYLSKKLMSWLFLTFLNTQAKYYISFYYKCLENSLRITINIFIHYIWHWHWNFLIKKMDLSVSSCFNNICNKKYKTSVAYSNRHLLNLHVCDQLIQPGFSSYSSAPGVPHPCPAITRLARHVLLMAMAEAQERRNHVRPKLKTGTLSPLLHSPQKR